MDSRFWLIVRAATVCAAAAIGAARSQAAPPALAGPANSVEVAAPTVEPAAVGAALDSLDAWLGDEDNGNRWRTYLHADALRAELAKSDDADPAVLERSLQQFQGDAAGLDLAPFVAAREALAAHIAELKARYADDLGRLAWASRGDHTPISAKQFNAIRADLAAKVQTLKTKLAASPANAEGWTKYLRLDLIEPHLTDDYRETAESLAELDEVLRHFRTNQPGLELPVFTDVAKAIVKYRALATWAATARLRDSRPIYERYLTDLEKLLKRHTERPTIETDRQLARSVGVIDSLGQSPDFVGAMRKSYAHSNIFGSVSNNFIMRGPDRPIDRMSPVRDCILGTSISGSAHTVGNIQYNVLESNDSVELAIFLQGEAHSRTLGIHKPVQVRSAGVTTYWATKRISLSDEAFTSSAATAGAETHNQIRSIHKMGGPIGRKLIEKIAWKRAGEQKSQTEHISSGHTRDRVLREFEETVARDLAAARVRYDDKIRYPLVRRGVSPDYLRMNSGAQGVGIETLFATRSQLGAPSAPPAMLPGHDLAVQVHESAINNFLPLALASARIAQQTADNPPDLQGNVPNWLKLMSVARPKLAAAASAGAEMVGEAQERIEEAVGAKPNMTPPPFKPYSITLNAESPASIHFDDNRITIRVRAALLQSDDSEYKNWDFVIVYEIRQEGDRILLRRVGEIEAFPTGFDTEWPRQLSAEETGFRSVLKKNMNARAAAGQSFPQEIPIEPVRLSRFGVLVLRELIADDGWLTVGWGLP